MNHSLWYVKRAGEWVLEACTPEQAAAQAWFRMMAGGEQRRRELDEQYREGRIADTPGFDWYADPKPPGT